MRTTTLTGAFRRELATRVNGGLENSTSIDIRHASSDDTISFRVPPGRALDAFHHPFAHMGNQLEHDLQPAQIDIPSRN